jgi:hypothetical protein
LVSVRSINWIGRTLFFLPISFSLSIFTVDGMETKNSGTATVNRTALLCGVAGGLLLALGGLPLLDRVWALLGVMYWAFPGARDVLSVVVGAVLVTVAVTAHRRGRHNAQVAQVAQVAQNAQAAQAADVR